MAERKQKNTQTLPWIKEIIEEYGMQKCDILGFDIPKCVKVRKPEVPESKTHEYTLEITLKWPCAWEGQKDNEGRFLTGTIRTVEWEDRNSFHCMPKSICLKDICAIIRDKKQEIKQSDASQQ